MDQELKRLNAKLLEIISPEKGYFGRVYTWGQRPDKYEYIGYELTEDFLPTLTTMSKEQRLSLLMITNYFEIHAGSLKIMLQNRNGDIPDFLSEIAWSHFMTVIMFGMLEVALRISPFAIYNKKGFLVEKGDSIKKFLEEYLSLKKKSHITKKYRTSSGACFASFSEVMDHLWEEIRSGFIHEANLEAIGLEWNTLKGLGTEEDPIKIDEYIPVQELLEVTWQAVLTSYGYKGNLKLSSSQTF